MGHGARILIVEDQESEREALARRLRMEKYYVIAAASAGEASRHVNDAVDVVITDLRMESADGMELQRYWKSRQPGTPFILVTAQDDVSSAVEAMKLGADDYLSKPVNPDELVMRIGRCLEAKRKDDTIADLRHRLDERLGFERIVGQSKAIVKVFELARRAASTDSTVLITGERGTGKELIAEAIHQNSARKDHPFITVNVAEASEQLVESELFGHAKGSFTGATDARVGRFEKANHGTIFIRDIGDLSLRLQAQLLRVLENHAITPIGGSGDREVHVRLVAATSCDLEQMVGEGEFREDLYYQLNVIKLHLPPLRERREDIPLLVNHFLGRLGAVAEKPGLKLDASLRAFLETYHWPGNVRQLRDCLESMIVFACGDTLTRENLPATVERNGVAPNPLVPPHAKLGEVEREAVMQALQLHGGNRTHAANALGISVRTLQRRLRSWNFGQDR